MTTATSTQPNVFDGIYSLPEAQKQQLLDVLSVLITQIKSTPSQISAADRISIRKSIAQADAGEFVSDNEMQQFWQKHGCI